MAFHTEKRGGLTKVYPDANISEATRQAQLAAASATSAALSAGTAEAVSGPTYANLAAGEAATTAGTVFAVDGGGGLLLIYLRTAGVSTLLRTVATGEAVGILTLDTAALIATTPVSSSFRGIRTLGYATLGDGLGGLYVDDALSDAALAAAYPLTCKVTANGRYFRWLYEGNSTAITGETGVINSAYPVGDVRRYGVFPDAVDVTGVTFTSGSNVITGAGGTFNSGMIGMSVCSPYLTGSTAITPPKIATVTGDGSSCTLVNYSTLLAQNALSPGTGGCRIGTYWERDYASRVGAILANSVLPGVEIHMPPGRYNTGINMGTAQSGSKWHFNSVEMGLLHVIADAGFPGTAGPLQKVTIRGNVITYDRFGALGLQNSDLSQLNVICKSDPTKSLTGTVGRGVHIYTQMIDNHFGDFTIEDCGVGTALNTDGAFVIDSSECARNRFGKVWIKDSAGHGAIIMGSDHEFESIAVDGWGYGTADRQLPETPNLARCLELTGAWFFRTGGLRVDNLRVNQPAAGRANALYDVRFMDSQNASAAPAVYTPPHIRTASVSNIRHRGITIGDRVTPSGYDEVEFGTLTVSPVSGATIDAGYSMVHVNANSSPASFGYTKVSINRLVCRNPSVSINDLLQCPANTEIDIGTIDTNRIGGHAGRLLVFNGRGRVGKISHRQAGGSGSPVSITFANDGPAQIGICDLNAPGLPSIVAIDLTGAANFDVGPITTLGYRGTPVVKVINAANGVVRLGQISESSAAGTGLTFTGNTNVRLESGKITGLAKGTTGAAGGNTRCSAANVQVTGNTVNTDLAAGQVLTDGSCLNVTL